jgi:hypothetical protein
MLYHVSRNGQNYGPYTLEDLQKYVSSGNVLPTDLAKSDEMPDWVPVSQVLGMAMPPVAPAPLSPFGAPSSDYAQTAGLYPDPPNLHWALVLLIGVFTCGIFTIVWIFVQAAWVRKVDPNSKAMLLYIIAFVLDAFNIVAQFSMKASQLAGSGGAGLGAGFSLLVSLAVVVLIIVANFSMRDSIEAHYNGPEPIGLSLSGVMTFFFSIYYFQYHFTRINEMKRATQFRGTQI